MWDGILSKEYLDERGCLLEKFNGIVYPWMYATFRGMKSDAASSPVTKEKNGRLCRWTPEDRSGKTVIRDESFCPIPPRYERIDNKHRRYVGELVEV